LRPGGNGFRPVYDAPAPHAHQKVGLPGLLGGLLDSAAWCVLAHRGEGAGVFLAEHALDPPDEIRLLGKSSTRNYEGPIEVPGLLFQLL
jgi:hypothetical protein